MSRIPLRPRGTCFSYLKQYITYIFFIPEYFFFLKGPIKELQKLLKDIYHYVILHKIQAKNQNNLSNTGDGYKTNLPKSIVFLYISNNWLGKIWGNISIKTATSIKYLVIGVVNLLKTTTTTTKNP